MYDTAFECLVIPAVQYMRIPAVEYLGIPAVESPKDPVSVSHEYEAASVGHCEHHFDQSDIYWPERRVLKSWKIKKLYIYNLLIFHDTYMYYVWHSQKTLFFRITLSDNLPQ